MYLTAMSVYCVSHFSFISVFIALFAVSASTQPNLKDVYERFIEFETRLKESEKEITFLRETTVHQKKVIENQDIRIQSLETELAAQKDIVIAGREKTTVNNREIESLRDEVQDLHNNLIRVEANVKKEIINLKNRIQPSSQHNAKSPRQVVGGGIAFTAYLDHDADYGVDQTIKYNKVITNDGNGYNNQTGIFTCPEGGMYMFTFFIGERSESDSTAQMWADLVVNSQVMIDAVVETRHAWEDAQGGNTVVLRLKAGDSVWVKSEDGGLHVEGSSVRVTSFTGIYLYP